jgi:hypothetical protein
MARLAALLALIVVLVGAAHWWKPFLAQQRVVVTSTPSPGPTTQTIDIPLGAGARACVAPAAIDRSTGAAQVALAPAAQPVRLEIDATAPGYQSRRVVALPPVRSLQSVTLPLAPSSHDLVGSVCVRNVGRSRIALAGTNNPLWIGQAKTRIGRRELAGQAIALNLVETRRQSLLARLGTITTRASDLTGGLVPGWLAWILAVGLVLGVPCAIVAGYWAALRADKSL